MAIALVLGNLGVGRPHAVLSRPRRGGIELHLERLRLRTMLLWLVEGAAEMYGLVNMALIERLLPKSVTT